jgi:hypothetical protein
MDDELRRQRDTSLAGLEDLIRRGRLIRKAPAADATRAWQEECATAIHQLSGGSKAHWLSRAYSSAFLVRSAPGGLIVEVGAEEIVDRILDVLAQGAASLSHLEDVSKSSAATPRPRQFEFVHDPELRPVLEHTYDDGRDALGRGEFALALILSCGIIETLLTDALGHARLPADELDGNIADWSFEKRIAAAEGASLIRCGCSRLPPVARRYRELTDADGNLRSDAAVSERDAVLAGQVLRVVMRDLDPGR